MRQFRTFSVIPGRYRTRRINKGELILLHDRDGDVLHLEEIQGCKEVPETNSISTEARDGGGLVIVTTIEGDKLLD